MATFDKMIPHILKWETKLQPKYYNLPAAEMFLRAKAVGYANDPRDSGGPTMCGVTLSTYRQWRKDRGYKSTTIDDLKAISFSDWKAILKKMFWDRWKADQIRTDMIAYALVDWLWVSGTWGIRKPQKLLGVKVDGIVGKLTLNAINAHPNQQWLFEAIQQARRDYHEAIVASKPQKSCYLNGWQNRTNAITWEGFK